MRVALIAAFLISLQCARGQSQNTTDAPTSEPTTEPTIYFTTEEPETTVDECDSFLPLMGEDPTDDDTDCLFSAETTLYSDENIVASICGYENADGVQYVSVTLTLPSDIWFGVGFVNTANYDPDQRMYGYSVIAPSCDRDLEERFLTGKGVNGLGDVLSSSITVYEDTIEEMVRTLRFTRPVTVTLADIGGQDEAGENLLAIDDGRYFDFSTFQECEQSIKMIYAFGSTYWDASVDNYHGGFRGAVTAYIAEVADDVCDDDDVESAVNSFSMMAGAALSVLVGVMLL